jgi:hypothetical protein
VDVVPHKRESIDGAVRACHDLTESFQELPPIDIIRKEIAFIATP